MNKEIKCFNIITNPKDKKCGRECGRLLIKTNSMGKVMGQIKCPRCKAIYDITENKIKMISKGE